MASFLSRLFGRGEKSPGFRLDWDGLQCRPSSGGRKADDWATIEPILRGMEGGDGHVILGLKEQHYIQAAVGIDGLVVEYREDNGDHYACVDPLTVQRTIDLFKAFFEDPASIHEKGRWHKVDL
ncbi:MAG: hypothetical protein IPM33_08345 [Phycisphaerales bacterium]|nr:hypothetical protein [Phycisphaerales bacterium]